MSTARVNCPSCRRLFEFDEEFRGEIVDCPRCATPFQIPLAGTEGVLCDSASDDESSRDEAAAGEMFDIACPYCRTVFELPADFRGELAECAECAEVFAIPETGNQGLRLDERASAAPASAPATPPPPGNSKAGTAAPQETSSGILIEPSLSAAGAGRTATVRLSRREVVANLMKPRELGSSGDDLEENVGGGVSGRADDTGGPVLTGAAQGNFIPLDSKNDHVSGAESSRPPIRLSDLPSWVPRLDLDRDESIVEFEAGAEPSLLPCYLLTGIPVMLIPVAVILTHFVHPAISASLCFLLALGLWGFFAAVKLPNMGRKILVLTSERAIMADTREVVDIDIDLEE